MEFKEWLEQQGCQVDVTQEDDGSGYTCLEVRIPTSSRIYQLTVA